MANMRNKIKTMAPKFFALDSLILVLKYLLIGANCVIILDAIFLLISEKDSYQGEFIAGRHKVSRYLLIMLYVDIQSILMILIAAFGIIGVQKANYPIVSVYGLIIAIIAIFSFNDLDAFVMEVVIAIWALLYVAAIKKSKTEISYNEMISESNQKV
jgi:hypothetical protein